MEAVAHLSLNNEISPDSTGVAISSHSSELVQPAGNSALALRVGRAWQIACRELRKTHPEVHKLISRRVLTLLDPEILAQVESQQESTNSINDLQRPSQSASAQITAMQSQLDNLHAALAQLLPAEAADKDPHTAAMQRIASLANLANLAGTNIVPIKLTEIDGIPPSYDTLIAISGSQHTFTPAQREWAIAELVIRSGGEISPTHLLAEDDQTLAKRLLA